MSARPYSRLLQGHEADLDASLENFRRQPVDQVWQPAASAESPRATTLAGTVSVTGPGTFFSRAQRTLTFEPTTRDGWWFDRTDLPDSLPIPVTANSVWTTQRNVVLCSGSPHNYMRMVEHIIALKRALAIDRLTIRMEAGDPPLFDRGSLDLVEAFERAGVRELDAPARYVTVREPVAVAGPRGSFLVVRPCAGPEPRLDLDVAVDFKTAIRQQRLQVRITPETGRYGAVARTNCSFSQMVFTKTVGQLLADVRHLGYTTRNILVAGRWGYWNAPRLVHEGKALEAVWHRTILDLVAALALIDGRFVGEVWSYKAGHALDVNAVQLLEARELLVPFTHASGVSGR